jgi:hypothetical protein
LRWQIARERAHGALAGALQHPDRLPVAAPARLREPLALKRLVGGPDRVEPVGLGAGAARRALGPIDLDHPLALLEQVAGQPGAVAAGRLDRPHPPPRGVLARERQQPPVTQRVGRRRRVRPDDPGCDLHDRRGVGVAMGVDTDRVVGSLCEHLRDLLDEGVDCRQPARATAPLGETVMGHTPTGWTGF